MKLWMSSELDADVDEKNSQARRAILAKVNEQLAEATFEGPWTGWKFIVMILRSPDDYKEVAKKWPKVGALEFRLKVDHATFKRASQAEANQMVLEALGRSVDKMPAMGVPEADIGVLKSALAAVAKTV